MVIEYRIINRSELELNVGEKKMIINGEIIVNPPGFNIYFFSIKKWEPPFEKEEIPDELKYKIIKRLIEESQKKENVRLSFD